MQTQNRDMVLDEGSSLLKLFRTVRIVMALGFKSTNAFAYLTAVLVLSSFGRLSFEALGTEKTSGMSEMRSMHGFEQCLDCPEGWTLISFTCYRVNHEKLTWHQASEACRSYGGKLAHISDVDQQIWLSRFLDQECKTRQQGDNRKFLSSSWIGCVQLPNKTFMWSNGQPGIKEEGFWAVDGLNEFYITPNSMLCCDMRGSIPSLHWYLSDCDVHKASLCEMQACEENSQICADGSKCVNRKWFCDGQVDCEDGSDETGCDYAIPTFSTTGHLCGASIQNDSGTMMSPNFPRDYPPFSKCIWRIRVSHSNRIRLRFSEVDIEDKYDTVNVYDGGVVSQKLLLVSLGRKGLSDIYSSSNSVTIQFLSDGSVQRPGFRFSWISVSTAKNSKCGSELQATDEYISQELNLPRQRYSRHSVHFITCEWIIKASSDSHVSLQIHDLNLNGDDTLEVFDKTENMSSIAFQANHLSLFSFGIKTRVPSIWTTEVAKHVPVVIVSTGAFIGVKLKLITNSLSKIVVTFRNGCDVEIFSSTAMILSPGYASFHYHKNMNCSWHIRKDSQHTHLTAILPSNFQTELGSDYLEIAKSKGKASNDLIANLSGTLATESAFSSSEGLSLHFISDKTVNYGQWAAFISYDCQKIQEATPLLVNANETKFGTLLRYSCPDGFTLLGSKFAICGPHGQWLPQGETKCDEIICKTPTVPFNAYITNVTGFTYGSKTQYKCFYGYTLSGVKESTCSMNGWKSFPVCEVVSCPKEPPPIDGLAKAEETQFGSLREYFCQTGYKLKGSKFSQCTINGTWSHGVPKCVGKGCSVLGEILHGRWNNSKQIHVGDTVEAICDHGYYLQGVPILKCQGDFTYGTGTDLPYCKDINECLQSNICGIHECHNNQGNYVCICKKGFQHFDHMGHYCIDKNECLENNGGCSHECKNALGNYHCSCPNSSQLYLGPDAVINNTTLSYKKTCISTCSPLMTDGIGTVVYKTRRLPGQASFLEGSWAHITCPAKTSMKGLSDIYCTANGWSPQIGICVAAHCQYPTSMINGRVSFSSTTLESIVTYNCTDGFILRGPPFRICIKSFKNQEVQYMWSGSDPYCYAVKCPAVDAPDKGKVYIKSTTFRSISIFKCLCGYQLIGSSVIICTSAGKWSSPAPICIAKSCRHPGLPARATLSSFEDGFPVMSQISFQCVSPGYRISDSRNISCLPHKSGLISSLRPLLLITMEVKITFYESINFSTNCAETSKNSDEFVIYLSVQELVLLCNSTDIKVINIHEVKTRIFRGTFTLLANVSISSNSEVVSCMCGNSFINFIPDGLGTLFKQLRANDGRNCTGSNIKEITSRASVGKWRCPIGLRLHQLDGGNCSFEIKPVCIEDCIDEGINTIEDQGINGFPTQEWKSSSSVYTRFLKTDTPIDDYKTTSKIVQPTQIPLTTMQSPSQNWPHSTIAKISDQRDFSFRTSYNTDLKSTPHIAFTSPETNRKQQPNMVEKFVRKDTFSEGPMEKGSGLRNKFGNKKFCDKNKMLQGQNKQSNLNEKSVTEMPNKLEKSTSKPRTVFLRSTLNKKKSLVTQPMKAKSGQQFQKNDINQFQGKSPIFTVEVRDRMDGTFTVISCIDSVHTNINLKVNELVQEFDDVAKSSLPINCSGHTLKLDAGNIRFTGNKARLFVKFTFSLKNSSQHPTVSCGKEFETFISIWLPKKLKEVQRNLSSIDCGFINYTNLDLRLSNHGWDCPPEHVFDNSSIWCVHDFIKPTDGSIKQAFHKFMPFPVLQLPMFAAFSSLNEKGPTTKCLKEYREGILTVLNKIEPRLRLRSFPCPDIHIDITRNISVVSSGKWIIAESIASLHPMSENTDSQMLLKCSKFLSLHFQKPSEYFPTATLGQKYLPTCPPIALSPNGLKFKKSKFVCQNGLHYEHVNFRCINNLDTGSQSNERVHRSVRNLHFGEKNPDWTLELPACLDIQPPVFQSCPKEPVVVEGIRSVKLALPNLSDNSGIVPKITFNPEDFSLPYVFKKNTTLLMKATDTYGNMQVCNISVVVIDQTPPMGICPTHLVPFFVQPSRQYSYTEFDNTGVVVWDDSGTTHITYDPPNGTLVKPGEFILITVHVEDASRNKANCSFFMSIQRTSCHANSLPSPRNGEKNCRHTSGGQTLICSVSCLSGNTFAVQPPEQYICTGKGIWHPYDRVPVCQGLQVPNYEIHLLYHLRLAWNVTSHCVEDSSSYIKESLKPLLKKVCRSGYRYVKFSLQLRYPRETSRKRLISVPARIVIEQLKNSHTGSSVSIWCGKQMLLALKRTDGDVMDTLCGASICISSRFSTGNITCSKGFALIDYMCVECPAGTFSSNLTCFECPLGSYQIHPGQSHCQKCPYGTNTTSVGIMSISSCLESCRENYYSPNGMEPCKPCPLGTFQSKWMSTQCESCVKAKFGFQSNYCRKLCSSGYYSKTGTEPCLACPYNLFNPFEGSTQCISCPHWQVTNMTGSSNIKQCTEVSLCHPNPCSNEGKCIQVNYNFTCDCVEGYTGPTCKDKFDPCSSQPCLHHGVCTSVKNVFSCHCQQGFLGSSCEIVKDHCVDEPCLGGMCENSPKGFECTCQEGYEGGRCEINKNNCSSVVCHNQGFCVNFEEGFVCQCQEGFTGVFCEEDIDDCAPNYCLNGGHCIDNQNAFSCLCKEGFSGSLCEINTRGCFVQGCKNDGVCEDEGSSTTCVCSADFMDDECEAAKDYCASRPCQNNAHCEVHLEVPSGFTCSCQNGFTGVTCETDIDECDSEKCHELGTQSCENSPGTFRCNCLPGWSGTLCYENPGLCGNFNLCKNDGTCVEDGDSFICECPPEFYGALCQTPFKSCLSDPCQNDGQCIQFGPDFQCLCQPGYKGLFCEARTDLCKEKPCHNGGHCVNGIGSYVCRCIKGFTGENCKQKINECISQPCQQNALCTPLIGDFRCHCPPAFGGKACDLKLNGCESNPCENGGQCEETQGGFICHCSEKFSGLHCLKREEYICNEDIVCLNGGRCVTVFDEKQKGKPVCQCTPEYRGYDCGKERSPNFDLGFVGNSTAFCKPPFLSHGKLTNVSLCLWIRNHESGSNSPYLSLLTKARRTLITLSGMLAYIPVSSLLFIKINIADGVWHHLCFLLEPHRWAIIKDGKMLQQGKVISNINFETGLYLTFGQLEAGSREKGMFQGSVSSLNIFNNIIDNGSLQTHYQQCSSNELQGNVFKWVSSRSFLHNGVQISEPSQCQRNGCSTLAGKSCGNNFKTVESQVDKDPPVVVYCPRNIQMISGKSLVSVMWKEPEFLDNFGIATVKQNFRSGQAFPHGHHRIIYIAMDATNNSAKCVFHVFIRRSNCSNPLPPKNGGQRCSIWRDVLHCKPFCFEKYEFASLLPPSYFCGKEGVWYPPGEELLHFPDCTRTMSIIQSIWGNVRFEGPNCSSLYDTLLKSKLLKAFNNLNISNYIYNHGDKIVKCVEKRDSELQLNSENLSIYNVDISLDLFFMINKRWLTDQMTHAIKHATATSIFKLTSINMRVRTKCSQGSVLLKDKKGQEKCVLCPVDHYIDEGGYCKACPRGTFTTDVGQSHCSSCLDQNASENCQGNCKAGHYFDWNVSLCLPCPRGQYKSLNGASSCTPCPVGLYTERESSTHRTQCRDMCGLGEEIGTDGKCLPCPKGSYREDQTKPFCTPCLYKLTTKSEGSFKHNQCSIEQCETGHFLNIAESTCHHCPLGAYQPKRGAHSCIPCGVGLTTVVEGADSVELCKEGGMDECSLGNDNCPPNSKCVAHEQGFSCECSFGKSGHGCLSVCDVLCEDLHYCKKTVQSEIGSKCHCTQILCKGSKPSYQIVVIFSISVASITTLLVLLSIAVFMHRRKSKHKEHVRLYRDETRQAHTVTTSESLANLPVHNLVEQNPKFSHLPRMALMWHNQAFEPNEEEINGFGF